MNEERTSYNTSVPASGTVIRRWVLEEASVSRSKFKEYVQDESRHIIKAKIGVIYASGTSAIQNVSRHAA